MRYFKQLHPPAFWRFDDQGNGSLSANGQDNWTGSVCTTADLEKEPDAVETDEHWEPLTRTRYFKHLVSATPLNWIFENGKMDHVGEDGFRKSSYVTVQELTEDEKVVETDSTGVPLTKAPSPDSISHPGGVPRQIQVLRAQKAIKDEAHASAPAMPEITGRLLRDFYECQPYGEQIPEELEGLVTAFEGRLDKEEPIWETNQWQALFGCIFRTGVEYTVGQVDNALYDASEEQLVELGLESAPRLMARLTKERDAAVAEIGTLGRQLGESQATAAAMAAALRKFVSAKELWLPDSILPDHEGELVALTGLLTGAEAALSPDAGTAILEALERTREELRGEIVKRDQARGHQARLVTRVRELKEEIAYWQLEAENSREQAQKAATIIAEFQAFPCNASESAALRERLDSPILREIFGTIEDMGGNALADRLWPLCQAWMEQDDATAPAQTGRVEAPKAVYESESSKEHFPHEWRVAIYAFDHGGAIEAAANLIQAWEKGHEPMGSGNYRAPELGRLHNMDCKKVRGEDLTPGRAGRVLDLERQPGIPLEQWENQDAAKRERKRRSGQVEGGEK